MVNKEAKKPTTAPTPVPQVEKTADKIIEDANKLAPIPMASPF